VKHCLSSPLVVVVQVGADVRHLQIEDRGDALVLRALVNADGGWIEPQDVGIRGVTLSRHAAALRRQYRLQVESDAVQQDGAFHNKHRLRQTVVIETDPKVGKSRQQLARGAEEE